MKISIITATFNSASTLEDTLRSVLSQTYEDYELIIKDGSSKDKTLEIAKDYESQFAGRLKIISCPDKGIYDAMNQGVAAALGDVIGILNSDDMYYDDQVLQRIADAMSDESVGCVYGHLKFVDERDTNKVVREWIGTQYPKNGFRKGWHPAHPTFYARRRLFEEYGSFDTSFDVSADFELMLRFIEKHGVQSKLIPYYLVKMRMGGESTGSIKNIIKGNRNILRAFEKNGFKKPPFYVVKRLAPKVLGVLKTKLNRK